MNGFRRGTRRLGLLLALTSLTTYADNNRVQVLGVDESGKKLDVSYDPKMRWAPNDSLCIFTSTRSSICGTVTQAPRLLKNRGQRRRD